MPVSMYNLYNSIKLYDYDEKNHSREETITPAMALTMLERNTENRALSPYKVSDWLREMRLGVWTTTSDGIGFDTDGNLINGQHRLHALVEYGYPLDFIVCRNLSKEAFAATDTGKMRTAGDVLGIMKYTCGTQKAGIIRSYMNLRDGNNVRHKGANASNQAVLSFMQKNEHMVEDASYMTHHVTHRFQGLKPRNVGGLYWLFCDANLYDAREFFNMLAAGTNLHAEHPVFVLREKLHKDSKKHKKNSETDHIAWAIIAWNAFRKKKDIKQIIYNPLRSYPRPI